MTNWHSIVIIPAAKGRPKLCDKMHGPCQLLELLDKDPTLPWLIEGYIPVLEKFHQQFYFNHPYY